MNSRSLILLTPYFYFVLFHVSAYFFYSSSSTSYFSSNEDSDSVDRKSELKLRAQLSKANRNAKRKKTKKSKKINMLSSGTQLTRSKITFALIIIFVISYISIILAFEALGSRNINLVFLATSICMISIDITCILIGSLWRNYPQLSKSCYYVCAIVSSMYLCFICLYLQNLFFNNFQNNYIWLK